MSYTYTGKGKEPKTATGGQPMSQHTPEPWRVEKNYWGDVNIIRSEHFFIGCTIVRGIPELIPPPEEIEANTARIVACINGCAGLNPTAYRECVALLNECLIPLETDLMDFGRG